jgi:hypothetical protein
VNFNPVLIARGASSGTTNNGGASSAQSPDVTINQGSGGDDPYNSGLAPALRVSSNPIDETMNGAGYDTSPIAGFRPATLSGGPSATPAAPAAGLLDVSLSSPWLIVGLSALALLAVYMMKR